MTRGATTCLPMQRVGNAEDDDLTGRAERCAGRFFVWFFSLARGDDLLSTGAKVTTKLDEEIKL